MTEVEKELHRIFGLIKVTRGHPSPFDVLEIAPTVFSADSEASIRRQYRYAALISC